MRAIFVILLLVAAVAAGNWNTFDFNNRNLNTRDAKHQKFVLNLLRHLQNDLNNKDFLKYSNTIKIDNKNDYKDMNKVFTVMTMFQNGHFVKRGHTFNVLDRKNMVTTKVLYNFFDTMKNWNTVAQNLIWCRRHINEYQFWHLMVLLQTHHREFNNIVLPAMYEVLPTLFFTGDVMNRGMKGLMLNFDKMDNNKVVIMQNFTNGMLGSMIDDDNDNSFDLNDIKHNKINDWYTLKKVAYDINDQTRKINMIRQQNIRDNNKDIKTDVYNNIRNLNQGNKFDNNGEDRMNYFTQDIGLNNFYFFSRFGNSRVLDGKQMFNNNNNKATFQYTHGLKVNSRELKDKINRRGERYLYKMQQLLARYNLERLSNGLDNIKQIDLEGKVHNGVFTNLRFTNGLTMHNRMNDYLVNNDNNRKLIDTINDLEHRFKQTIDQGFVETLNGKKIGLNNKYGINILGNLMQENTDSVNTNYYRNLETYYRLVLGGNFIDNTDRMDTRFNRAVMGQQATTLRDPVFWQIMKRITNIRNHFKDQLTGYTKKDTDFNGVTINDVKVDKMVTTFGYFDADITNGFNRDLVKMTKIRNGLSNNRSNNRDSGSNSRTRNFNNRRGGRSGSYNRNYSGSNGRSINRTVLRLVKNWSNNRTNMRRNNWSKIRRVVNRSNIRNNNSVNRIMNRMNMSTKRINKNSVSRIRQLMNNRSFRRVLNRKLNRSGSRSTGRGFTRNVSWRNVFGLRNRSNNRSGNESVMRRFNRHGKFNNKFVRRNYNSNSSSGSNSNSGSNSYGRRSNGRNGGRFNWKNLFGLRNNGSGNRSGTRNNSVIRNLSKLRRTLNNVNVSKVRNVSKLRNLNKLRKTLNKIKNMSNVRGLKNVRGISKIRNNCSKIRNISKIRNDSNTRRNNSLIRNLSKLRKDLSIVRKINKNLSGGRKNGSTVRRILKDVRGKNYNSIQRVLRKLNKNNGNNSGNRSGSFNRSNRRGNWNNNRSNNRSNTGNQSNNGKRNNSMGRSIRRVIKKWNSKNRTDNRSDRQGSQMRHYLNKFGNRGTNNKLNYFKKIMGLNKFMVVGRQRRLDTKKFTVTIDLTSNKNTVGIVRMFLGPKINNKQQLNDNRKNFVELDQFIVKLNNGKNVIRRHSVDFKNVVGNPESLNVLYTRAMNFLRKGGKGGFNTLDNINYDTNNNNRGFPHRLLLPKGTTGGQDYTLFVTINDLDRTNRNDVRFMNGNNWNNFVKDTNKDNNGNNRNGNENDNTSSDSNSSSGSDSGSNSRGRFNSGSNSRSTSRGRFDSGSNSRSNSHGRFNSGSNSRGRFNGGFRNNGMINFNRRNNNKSGRGRFNSGSNSRSTSRGRFNSGSNSRSTSRGRFDSGSNSRSNSRGRFNSGSNSRGRFNGGFRNNGMINFNRRNNKRSGRGGNNNVRINNKKNVWCKNGNGVRIYNCNNKNKNIGNGNGVLDRRSMGFPLDRNIIDVNGFVTDNMFFKDVTIVHIDTSNNN